MVYLLRCRKIWKNDFCMQYLRRLIKPINILIVLVAISVVIGVIFRFYNLGFPDKQVFDEVYFPVFAKHYLNREMYFDIHPPLGKFIIALGIALFGDTTFGWRIVPCVVGMGTIFLVGYLTWCVLKDKVAALCVMLFVALDGLFIIYSRTGLMDGILFFAIFACFLSAVKLKDFKSALLCNVMLGLAMAIKWPAIGIFLPMLWYAWRAGKMREFLYTLPVAAVVYVAVVYVGQVIIRQPHPLAEIATWHSQVLKYNLNLTDTHPWGSPWWSWPIPKRPVLFLYDALPNGSTHIETTLGNPVVWWLSTVAVVASVVAVVWQSIKQRRFVAEHILVPLLLGYFALWLPWAAIKRVVFLYHYMPAYGFALMMLGYWIGKMWQYGLEIAVLIILAVSIFFGVRYLPLSVGWIPVSKDLEAHLIIIKTWLY
jgi:dolichyl-phosphate-mannose--protein O-mannosyl transferase